MIVNPYIYSNTRDAKKPQDKDPDASKIPPTFLSEPMTIPSKTDEDQSKEDLELKEANEQLKIDLTRANYTISQKDREIAELRDKLSHPSSAELEEYVKTLITALTQDHQKELAVYKQENARLRKENDVFKQSFDYRLLEQFQQLFDSAEDHLVLDGELFKELKQALKICLNPEGEDSLSAQERIELEELKEEQDALLSEKQIFDRAENKQIHQIEDTIDGYDQLKDERNQKKRVDRDYNDQIHQIQSKITDLEESEQRLIQEETIQAVANTIRENDRKHNRDSSSSSTPPSQQGLAREVQVNDRPAKRGAPQGHAGYRFDFDGLDLSEIDEETLEQLSERFPLEVVLLSPEEIPAQAQISVKSARVAFGMIKSPCILLYVQEEASYKDPENPRKRIKKVGEYPSWLKKSFSYSPDYKSEAVFLRLQLHASYQNISRYFNQTYWITTTPMTIWKWVHQAAGTAKQICEGIKEKLTDSAILGADETGIRDNGLNKWVFATTNKDWSLFSVSDTRSIEGVQDNGVLLNAAQGSIVIHDGYSIYDDPSLDHLVHARCWAHKNRDLKEILKFEDNSDPWILQFQDWFDKALSVRNKALDKGESAIDPTTLETLISEFDKIVAGGLKQSQKKKTIYKKKNRKILIRRAMAKLLACKDDFFDFLALTPPALSPWYGCELYGKKNVASIQELSKLAQRIDQAVALARQQDSSVPKQQQESLKQEFFSTVQQIYSEYKDSNAKINYKTPPVLKQETTQAYKFFLDLKKDREAFLRFLTDLNTPLTNNETERSLRPLKSTMKTVGSFRGYPQDHVALESVRSSAQKQKLNLKELFDELVYNNVDFIFDQRITCSRSKEFSGVIKTLPTKK